MPSSERLVRLTDLAEDDLDAIYAYALQGSRAAADRLIDEIIGRLMKLGAFPYMGRERDDTPAGLLALPAGSYLIFYRVDVEEVLVSRIVHGARDIPRLLDEG